MDKYIQAENRLADLLGWRLRRVGDVAIGWYDPDGDKRVRRPEWCNDNAAAFALIGEHGLRVYADTHPDGCKCVEVDFYEPKHGTYITNFAEHTDRDTAVRYCVVMAVIAKLEALSEQS